ncbi:unnamed protein product [Psylliodes chrysocephalus]|uniref:Uncharacterized protein n=1 Tax=Psylliodes chrysocephalus TaxID=3402493 RepID=A0A9P0G7X0_9CUCU|nr:unnamed protein product [Psylliodes chrysocephala]
MRHHVAKLLETILKDAMSPDTIKNGFRVCGLYPFDANNVDYSKILHKQHTKEADDTNKQDNVMNDDVKNCLNVLEANISANLLQIMKKHILKDEWKINDNTHEDTQNEEHVPQEVTKPSEEVSQEVWQEVIEDFHVTAESDKNHIIPEEYHQVHAAITFDSR